MRYEIVIEETLSRIHCLDAEDEQQALALVEQMYKDQQIVLDSEDFVQVEISIKQANA